MLKAWEKEVSAGCPHAKEKLSPSEDGSAESGGGGGGRFENEKWMAAFRVGFLSLLLFYAVAA